MNKNIIDQLILANNNLIIPNYMIKFYSLLNLNDYNFIFIVYLLNQKGDITLDLNKISNDLNIEQSKLLDIISDLSDKKYISIDVKKRNGIIEEYISLDLFYSKIKMLLIEENNNQKNSDIYSVFEQEFGRTLSPTEYETISNWVESNIPLDLIKSALKEAILNGVNSLRYIDKILFEWNKKGYKTSSDIVNKNVKKDDYIEEIYDYDWLNE